METVIFQVIGKSLDKATATYITSTAARVISDFMPVAIIGITLFITCYGYLVIAGRVQEPFTDFLLKCTKIIVIAAFALNTPIYLDWVVSAIDGLQSGLSSALGQADPSGSVYQALDSMLDRTLVLMGKCVENAKNTSFTEMGDVISWYIEAGLIACSAFVLLVTGGMIIMISSVMLKILLAIGPIFILCLMWPITAKFFDMWFAQTMTYLLKTVLVVVVIAFAIKIFSNIIDNINPNSDLSTSGTLEIFVETLVAGYLLYKIMLEVAGMASGLAGGIAAATMRFGQIVSAAAVPVQASTKTLAKTASGIKTAGDFLAGKIGNRAGGGLTKNIGSSNSETPAYQRKLIENLNTSWRK